MSRSAVPRSVTPRSVGPEPDIAIRTEQLTKTYPGKRRQAPVTALAGLDLIVPAGTVHGLLGHNGAGKSTTVRILATLLSPTSGNARVAGHDVGADPAAVRSSIGLVGQYAAVDEPLTGRDNLLLFGRLAGLSPAGARARAGELLEQFRLTEAAARPVSGYSGGMRRRLDLAASLLTTPPVLFVDEPTTGLDPAGRRDVWSAVAELAQAGTTVLLTTQYLEEADRLADAITILRDGAVAAEGTPDQLKAELGGDRAEITFTDPEITDRALAALAHAERGDEPGVVRVPIADSTRDLIRICSTLDAERLEPDTLQLRHATLDDVFLTHTASEGADR